MYLAHLWLPVLLGTVAVFFASFVCWTVLPHHKSDFQKLPDEGKFTQALRGLGLHPGNYAFPFCGSNAQMKDPEFQKRYAEGPTGCLSVWPPMSMGRNLGLTFLVQLIATTLIGSLLWTVLKPGQPFGEVFEVGFMAGLLAWCFAFLPNQIWFGQTSGTMVRHILDGVVYAAVTAAIFAGLWPAAA